MAGTLPSTSRFRAAVDSLVPYQPGRPVELVRRELGLTGPVVKLASNEGQYGPFPAALEAIARAAADGNRYPDGGSHALRSALAERHGLDLEQVVAGNGADAVLNYLALAMLEPGDEVAFCWPSFPVYPINAAKMGAVGVRAPLAGSSYDLDALAAAITPRTKIAYVTNPNNPTGGLVRREALARFLDELPAHVLPVVDEAYFEYVDDPDYPDALREHLLAGRRVVVLRTFSKIYGLAGLRVGWGAMPLDVAAALGKVKNAFDVSQPAQDAARASIGRDDEIARRRDETRAGRERLFAGLVALGLEPLPAVANFVAVPVGDGAAIASALERRGVIVRPLGGFGDPASIRISVGLPDEIERALRELGDVLAQG
ncbi:MAG TPA: histidinol-phosphate transaminase [Gaiellales bacterium]